MSVIWSSVDDRLPNDAMWDTSPKQKIDLIAATPGVTRMAGSHHRFLTTSRMEAVTVAD